MATSFSWIEKVWDNPGDPEIIMVPMFGVDSYSVMRIEDSKRRLSVPAGSLWVCDGEEKPYNV
jgi:hypothetical protein